MDYLVKKVDDHYEVHTLRMGTKGNRISELAFKGTFLECHAYVSLKIYPNVMF